MKRQEELVMPTHWQTQNNPTALLLGTTPRETVGGSREGFSVECLQEARWTNLKQEHRKERHSIDRVPCWRSLEGQQKRQMLRIPRIRGVDGGGKPTSDEHTL